MGTATLTPPEIHAYYNRIHLPQKHRHERGAVSRVVARDAETPVGTSSATSTSTASATNPALSLLTALQTHHKAHIPFENLSLHYSATRGISIEPEDLKRKILGLGETGSAEEGGSIEGVAGSEGRGGAGAGGAKGRGGYCMENNALFGLLLRSLGFRVYPVGGRVSSAMAMVEGEGGGEEGGGGWSYSGWSHMLNIVTIGHTRYFVDVGFGANGPNRPIALTPSSATPNPLISPSLMRLVRGHIPEQQHPSEPSSEEQDTPEFWIYQIKHTPESDWLPAYCFTETPFIAADFRVMNFATSQGDSWFRREIVCAKSLLGEGPEGEGVVVGELVLAGGRVKKRVGGSGETVCVYGTEGERVEALRDWFGIGLEKREREGIRESIAVLARE